MKIACGTVTFREYPLEEALSRIKKAGYEYVEPQATAPFCPHINVDQDDPAKFKQLLKSIGFKGATALWTTHGAIIPDPKSVEYGKKCAEWAAAAGIPGINIGDGFKPREMSDDDALKLVEERLAQILETAEKCRVYVAIEPHGTFSLNAAGLKKLMSLSNSKWLGINYDTANVHRAAYVESKGDSCAWKSTGIKHDEVAVLKAIADRVVHLHVKDVRGKECVALGQGEVNIKGCLEVLRDSNYRGPISLETEGDFGADVGSALISASRDYLLKTLKEIQYK
ncbi:MAG: sugar phosphate isomerase/epimerase [Kiritimatiellaeota bacterium]|nr:sugar phosphate isomerase/epimerase [Kiritimatiellota bacterium]